MQIFPCCVARLRGTVLGPSSKFCGALTLVLTGLPSYCLSRTPTPYQLHNEAIVNHLYNAGFQTGVRTSWVVLKRTEADHCEFQNYADSVLVNRSDCFYLTDCVSDHSMLSGSMCIKTRTGCMLSFFRDRRCSLI